MTFINTEAVSQTQFSGLPQSRPNEITFRSTVTNTEEIMLVK